MDYVLRMYLFFLELDLLADRLLESVLLDFRVDDFLSECDQSLSLA